MSTKETVSIDGDLKKRLAVIAEREGSTVSELAEGVLRLHAEDVERQEAEFAEDDRRWARYLETGESISLEDMKAKLHALADQAGRKARSA
jgi:predicted transcriptional regulator